ncbi:MAG TPA: DUF6064 family protein [Gemmatimonadales bacterium]|nr:DUF6064 family protein [Gemmatimonadales bacterium]
MQDWWSYTISDFLLFSPRTYYRMIERYNAAVWPAQLLTTALGVAILAALRSPSPRQNRIIATVLAVLWMWVAWAFLLQRYATINWAIKFIVPLFVLEALLLIWWGGIRGELSFEAGPRAWARLGAALFVIAVLVYPTLAVIMDRPWRQAEVFGAAPDPTAIGTVGLLLMTNTRVRWGLLPVPLLWSGIAGATLWALSAQS